MKQNDIDVLRQLAGQLADIAHLPAMAETRQLWIDKNALRPVRPLVLVDELPWNEMDVDGFLRLQVEDPFWRMIENQMRQTLYKWRYIPSDMVIDPWIAIPRAIDHSGYGLAVDQDIAVTDPNNNIVGHAYHQQLRGEDDLEKIVQPVFTENRSATEQRQSEAHTVFDGLLDVHMQGVNWYFAFWDMLVEWMGPDHMLMDVVDRPEFLHAAIDRLVTVSEVMALQAERDGLTDDQNTRAHCTYTYNDFLPHSEPGEISLLMNCWCHGTAQIFGSISPAVHDELEFSYVHRIFRHFGAANYGCCEPLHDRIDLVRKLPNIRKISCSPWCDMDIAAEQIGRDYVVSNKPAPAFVGGVSMNWQQVEHDLRHTVQACRRNQTPLEFILKDISTVAYDPRRLWQWGKLAMQIAQDG